MLSCLIVEDAPSAVDILRSYIDKTPFLTLTGTAHNPLEALDVMQTHSVDLMFLDVHMPHITGIEFLKMIQGRCQVIMTTAYSEFALQGYEHAVLDYLLKPISFDRFLQATQRALAPTSPAAPEATVAAAEPQDDYIFVKTKTKGKVIRVKFKDILYVESMRNYVTLYTTEGSVVTQGCIRDLEEQLPDNFVRVQKSYVVSTTHIREVEGNQIFLYGLTPSIPVGETYRRCFFNLLEEKMLGAKK